MYDCSLPVSISNGMIFLSIKESIHHIPQPQMRADTQTFTEISFLLLPGLRLTGFESKPAGEDRKLAGLLWLGLLGTVCTHTHTDVSTNSAVTAGFGAREVSWRKKQKKKKKDIFNAVELLICAHKLIIHDPKLLICVLDFILLLVRQLISGHLSRHPNR